MDRGTIQNTLKMLNLLRKNDKLKISELAELLNVKDRQVRRYRDELLKVGYDIPSKAGKDGGYTINEINLNDNEWTLLKDLLKKHPEIYSKIDQRFNMF